MSGRDRFRPDTVCTGVLACPHCGLALVIGAAAATCANRHAFDRARHGSINLLVGGRLPSQAQAGDTPDSLAARRRFLGAGVYAPIVDALAEVVGSPDGPVLDVGCGEGYYLSCLDAATSYGIDVSKRAVQMASRALPDAMFAVASAHRLPVLDGSVAVAMSVFAPHRLDELTRVLQPGGRWVTVTPGPRHLQELRPLLTGASAERAADRLRRRESPPPGAAEARRVERTLALDEATAHDLLAMTPLRWQAGAVRADGVRHVTLDVWVAASSPAGDDRPGAAGGEGASDGAGAPGSAG